MSGMQQYSAFTLHQRLCPGLRWNSAYRPPSPVTVLVSATDLCLRELCTVPSLRVGMSYGPTQYVLARTCAHSTVWHLYGVAQCPSSRL